MAQIRCLNESHGNNFSAYNGDCVDILRQMPSDSVDFSVYSPPFGSLFVYSESAADMGNSTDEEFVEHYGFLVREKFRLTKPGRVTAVHCSDLPMTKWKDGAIGIKDFSGQIIKQHEDAGWIMHSRRTIWKCPVTEREQSYSIVRGARRPPWPPSSGMAASSARLRRSLSRPRRCRSAFVPWKSGWAAPWSYVPNPAARPTPAGACASTWTVCGCSMLPAAACELACCLVLLPASACC